MIDQNPYKITIEHRPEKPFGRDSRIIILRGPKHLTKLYSNNNNSFRHDLKRGIKEKTYDMNLAFQEGLRTVLHGD